MHSTKVFLDVLLGLFNCFGSIILILQAIFKSKVPFGVRIFGIISGVTFLFFGCLLLHQVDPDFLPFLDKLSIPNL